MPPTNDHDLLIRLDTNQGNLSKQITDLRDGAMARIASMDTAKVDKSAFQDYKESMRKIMEDIHREFEQSVQSLAKNEADAIRTLSEVVSLQGKKIGLHDKLIYIGLGIVLTLQFVILLLYKGQ